MTTVALVLIAVLSSFRSSGDRAPVNIRYMIEQGSHLSIQGTTNVNTFECFSRQAFGQQALAVQLDQRTNTVTFERAVLNVRVKELACDNSKIDADLCDALKADDFPHIVIELHDAHFPKGNVGDDWTDIIISATLKITDQKRKIELKAKGKILADGRYKFMAAKALKMTDFGVEPPTALFGLIKVNDEITINFNLTTRVTLAN